MDTTMPAARAAIYTRISQDQTGERAGVTRQLEECRALAGRLNFTVVAHFDDNDMSAFTGKTRPGYEAMLAGMKRGEFTAIVCYHPDRLYRSLKDLERLIDIADATGVQIRSVNGGDFDLSNATGKMIARILGSVSRQESEHKAERQRSANTARRAAGQWQAFGRVPFGYAKVGEPPHRLLVPKEPEATMVRQAVAHVLAGGSLRSIAVDWNRRGVPTIRGNKWASFTVKQLLENPVYAGLVMTTIKQPHQSPSRQGRRVVATGDWEPLFDEEVHHALMTIFKDPGRRVNTLAFERKYMGSGVYLCGVCGAKLSVKNTGKSKYCCYDPRDTSARTSAHVTRSLEPVDDLVTAVVINTLLQTNIRGRLVDRPDVDLDGLRTRRAAWAVRADELARMFADGEIDGNQLRAGSAGLQTKIAEIDAVLAAAVASSPAAALLEGDPDEDELVARFDAAPPDIKGKIVDELMTVTINKVRKGSKFNPDAIDITPKR
jgi:DNA invertase Pin-like site-specific DNA recombinase